MSINKIKLPPMYDYAAYNRKYKKKHKSYAFNLDYDKDADLIKLLDGGENKSELIRWALKKAFFN